MMQTLGCKSIPQQQKQMQEEMHRQTSLSSQTAMLSPKNLHKKANVWVKASQKKIQKGGIMKSYRQKDHPQAPLQC